MWILVFYGFYKGYFVSSVQPSCKFDREVFFFKHRKSEFPCKIYLITKCSLIMPAAPHIVWSHEMALQITFQRIGQRQKGAVTTGSWQSEKVLTIAILRWRVQVTTGSWQSGKVLTVFVVKSSSYACEKKNQNRKQKPKKNILKKKKAVIQINFSARHDFICNWKSKTTVYINRD